MQVSTDKDNVNHISELTVIGYQQNVGDMYYISVLYLPFWITFFPHLDEVSMRAEMGAAPITTEALFQSVTFIQRLWDIPK